MLYMSQASRSNQSAVGHTGTTLSISSAVVEPGLHAHAARVAADPEQVVGDREALRLRVRPPRVALRPGCVQVAPAARADVAGDARLAPAEVVGGREVGEHVEARLVAQVRARLHDPRRVDDERRLAERLAGRDEPGNGLVHAYSATPRIW